VAHRTLLARRRENGAYDLFDLLDRSSRSGNPIATALSPDAVFDHVAFDSHEFVVVEDGTRTTYRVVPFSVPTGDLRPPVGGACVALRPEAGLGEEYVRGWTHATKETLGDAVDRGLLSEREALVYLEERVLEFAGTTEVIVP
jgi:hypothetical protein